MSPITLHAADLMRSAAVYYAGVSINDAEEVASLERTAMRFAVRAAISRQDPGWIPGDPPLLRPVHIIGRIPVSGKTSIIHAQEGVVETLVFRPERPQPPAAVVDHLAEAARQVRALGQRLLDSLQETLDAADLGGPATTAANTRDRALIADWESAWLAFEDALAAAREPDA